MIQKKFILHGHFYQPPRENPWTGSIDRQVSAYPFNDWNDRINTECYAACTRTPVLENGEVMTILNCYEYLSFNIGPTLLSWMDREDGDRETVRKIIEADQISVVRNGGHGNAIAQAFSHMIMPLANERDQRTQVLWGLKDFRSRFGRESEGLWLGETAINNEVAALLVDCGVKHVILSPFQAQSVTKNGASVNVVGGSVDPSRPYKLHTKNGDLAVFFYDPNLASEISFGELLSDANRLFKAVKNTFSYQAQDIRLVHTATDGEVYGHHKAYGNMALARLVYDIQKSDKPDFQFTNYGKFLEDFPPTEDCELFLGDLGEGSSWSCAHGVGRWIRDCSCHTGGQEGWNQKWRTPLREAFDVLRDEIHSTVEDITKDTLKDTWEARNDYIKVFKTNTLEAREEFFERNQKRALSVEEKKDIIKSMESLRFAMLMYTSCGWFFNDLSGIETVQDLLYAERAYECLEGRVAPEVYTKFREFLDKAHSNILEEGSGQNILERSVYQYKVSKDTLQEFSYWNILKEGLEGALQSTDELDFKRIWEDRDKKRFVYRFQDYMGFENISAFSLVKTQQDDQLLCKKIDVLSEVSYDDEGFWNANEEWSVAKVSALPLFLRIKLIARGIRYEMTHGYHHNRAEESISLDAIWGTEEYLLPYEKKILVFHFASSIYKYAQAIGHQNGIERIDLLIREIELLKSCATPEEAIIFLDPIAVSIAEYFKRALQTLSADMVKDVRMLFWCVKDSIGTSHLDILRDITHRFYISKLNEVRNPIFVMEFKTIMKDMSFTSTK